MQNNTIKQRFISFNANNGETHLFCTTNSIQGFPDAKQIEFYKSFLNEEQLESLNTMGTCCLSVYEMPNDECFINTFIKEAFGNLLKALVESFGDDECLDYLPSAIEEFFSVLQAFKESDNPYIQEALDDCDLDLWANLYDTYMQSFDPEDEASRNYIGTGFLTWAQGMIATPDMPAIIIQD